MRSRDKERLNQSDTHCEFDAKCIFNAAMPSNGKRMIQTENNVDRQNPVANTLKKYA